MGNHGTYETALSGWSGLVGHSIGCISRAMTSLDIVPHVAVTYMQSCVTGGDTPSTPLTPSPYRGLACPHTPATRTPRVVGPEFLHASIIPRQIMRIFPVPPSAFPIWTIASCSRCTPLGHDLLPLRTATQTFR